MKIALLQIECRPVFVELGGDGRPGRTILPPDAPWIITYHDLEGLKQKVDDYEKAIGQTIADTLEKSKKPKG